MNDTILPRIQDYKHSQKISIQQVFILKMYAPGGSHNKRAGDC